MRACWINNACIYSIYGLYMEYMMGIVNIEDELHDQIRKASTVSCRSINAQAAFWVRIGMLCELNPTQSFNEIMARELRAAGVVPQALKVAS